MAAPQLSLDTCLARVQKAEQQLSLALNEIVDTRACILQLSEQSRNGYDPKATPTEEYVVSIDSIIDREMGNAKDVKLTDKVVDEYLDRPSRADVKEEYDGDRAGMTPIPEGPEGSPSSPTVVSTDPEANDLASPSPQDTPAPPATQGLDHPHAPPADVFCPSVDGPQAASSSHWAVAEICEKTAYQLGLSAEDVENAYNLFCQHDADQSGMLSVHELHEVMKELTRSDISQKETDHILREVDKNFDSELDFEEFLLFICNTKQKKKRHLEAAVYQEKKLNRGFQLKMKGISYTKVVGFLRKEVEEMTAFLSFPVIILVFMCFVLSAHLHRDPSVLHSFENSFKSDIEDNANFAFSGMTPFENGREGFKNIYDMHTLEDFWSWMDLGLMPLFFPTGWGGSEARSNVAQYCSSPYDSMKGHGWDVSNFAGDPSVYSSTRAYFLDSNLCDLEVASSEFPEPLKSLDPFADSEKKPYRLFNEIIAGVRISQEQLPHVDCKRPELSGRAYVTPCIEENGWAWLEPHMDTALEMNDELINKPGGETIYLKSATPLSEVKGTMRQLEDARWMNQKTSKVQILLTTYNNHMDMFSAIYINVFINRAGTMHKVVKPVCIWLHPYRNAFSYVTDVALALLVLRLFVCEVFELARALKEKGVRAGLANYFQYFKNVIDWLSIVYSCVIFTFWLVWCQKVSAFGDTLKGADANVKGSWPSEGDVFTPSNAEYWEEVDNLVHYQHIYLTYVLAYYPFVIGARFFAICNSQPRLGLVTATLSMAAKDIFHFLVLLFATLVIFCASGELLFGLEVEEYENFGRTFISVFRAMLGDFDYIALTRVGRAPAAIWWVAFVVLVNLIMLNMLLVIIMDVYGHIKSGLNSDDEENFPTIWSQSIEIFERWNKERRGTEIPITKILKDLEAQHASFHFRSHAHGQLEPRLITVQVLVDHVPGLSVLQAEQLLEMTYEWDQAVRYQHETHSNDDLMAKLRVLDLRIQQNHTMLDTMETMLDSIEIFKV